MRAFRHWDDHRWALDFLVRGRIRLAPIGLYWNIENAAPGVRDKLDGSTQGTLDALASSGRPTPEFREIARRFGVKVGAGTRRIYLGGLTTVRRPPPLYIFCMSKSAAPGIFDKTAQVTPVLDVERLGFAVAEASNGRFTAFQFGPVTYRRVEFDGLTDDLQANAFVKATRFAPQQEIRLAFEPGPGFDLTEPQFVESPAIRDALR